MQKFIVLFALVAAATAFIPQPRSDEFPFGRIVNGVDTLIENHPWQVSLQRVSSGSHFCGGSLIDATTVLTAAHCLDGFAASAIRVRCGSTLRNSGGQLIDVASLKMHEGYNTRTKVNDIGIIKLSTPVTFNEAVQPIEMASKVPEAGTHAVVSGWGTTCFLFCSSPNTLMEVDVNIVELSSCANDYGYASTQILDTMLCAWGERKDACQGDSGGPLVANNQLVGVVSWGSGCGRANYPGVYADVARLRNWVEDNAKSL